MDKVVKLIGQKINRELGVIVGNCVLNVVI